MKRVLLACALASGMLALPVSTPRAADAAKVEQGDPEENRGARLAAMEFLSDVDEGNVGDSWEYASEMMHGILTRAEWEKGVDDARSSIGELQKRELIGAAFSERLQSMPVGHYYTVYYASRFEAGWYQEKVVLSHNGGEWKLEGYWITPSDEKGNPKKS
jgi:hypothetical protein